MQIINPNSSGQGHCADYVNHPLTRVAEEHGYKYSHSVYVTMMDDQRVMYHCFKLGEHNVGLYHKDDTESRSTFTLPWQTSCSCASGHKHHGYGADALSRHLKKKDSQYKLTGRLPARKELQQLVKDVKSQISDEYRAFEGDETPGIQLTVGWNPENGKWSYQTGDNSYTGGAYSHPVWAVVGVYRSTNCKQLAVEIQNELNEGKF